MIMARGGGWPSVAIEPRQIPLPLTDMTIISNYDGGENFMSDQG